jgi:UDP-N-acetylmuramyl pentapeptide phosphotransferase/UDP-N-acetylglucosamine-1-phosphate transferase
VTRKVGPALRLIMATASAAWLYATLEVSIQRTDVAFIDWMLSFPGIPLFTTLLVVAGFTHSVNIIDGFHGLACGLMIIALAGLSFMAYQTGDALVLQLCLTSFFVFLGFFIFNWPSGSIFLGDAGAYLTGFCVVELGILLVMRNKEISPMAPVVAGLLPLIETLFSMYRRKIVRERSVNHPDALHLHTLVYRRLLLNSRNTNNIEQKNSRNSQVAIYFWLPASLFTFVSCLFMQSTWTQLVLMLIYLTMYVWLYKKLVKFKSPFIMKFQK